VVDRQWFAVKTKPRREVQTKTVLIDRGIEIFLPEVPTQRRPGLPCSPREPLFPGYLFARLALTTPEWVVARSAPGVSYFVGVAGAPSAVPTGLVDTIRARSELLQRQGWRPPFQPGDRVRIAHGPLAGLDAVFDHTLSSAGRVRVFLEVLSRLVPVDLDAGDLRRAG
jgi:transcriptional antiterminator RfaH